MTSYAVGEKVIFHPKAGGKMDAVVERVLSDRLLSIRIANDPFPVPVKKKQVSACEPTGNKVKSKKPKDLTEITEPERKGKMAATATKPTGKELRKEAQGLGIKDFEDMGRGELVKAIKKAKKNKNGAKPEKVSRDEAEAASRKRAKAKAKAKGSKKSAAKAASKSAPAKSKAKPSSKGKSTGSDGNPFRPGSNLHLIHNLLVKGGNREKLAQKLADKVALHPYTNSADEIDLIDYDKRIVLAAQTLRDQHGYKIEREGRGLAGSIKVMPGKSKAKAKK